MIYKSAALASLVLLAICSYSVCLIAQTQQQVELQRKYTGKGYSLCGSCNVPKNVGSNVTIANDIEPGDRMILSGKIFKEDGVTPDSGITLFVYQTDAGGYYHRPKEDVFHPKIFGWLRTGKDGTYEIRSIKPAPEVEVPNEPAHVHVHIFGKGMEEHFLHEFWFRDDSRIPANDMKRLTALGTFSPIVTLTKGGDGIWRGTRNIKVRPAAHWKYEED